VIGVDYWGKQWAYAQGRCEKNAHREGVASRVGFQKASASALPFEEGRFDLVVSNLTFHEVEDTPDKRDVVHEALRVVKPGGQFVFQDLFLWKRIYGTPEELLAACEAGESSGSNLSLPVIRLSFPGHLNSHSWLGRSQSCAA
jgi:ubiquinone/menaquinone biosynthesis C-methylase UbiE